MDDERSPIRHALVLRRVDPAGPDKGVRCGGGATGTMAVTPFGPCARRDPFTLAAEDMSTAELTRPDWASQGTGPPRLCYDISRKAKFASVAACGRMRAGTLNCFGLAAAGEVRRDFATSPVPYRVEAPAIMPNEETKSGVQKAAEAEVEGFRKDLGPFVVAAETTRMPMVFTDAKEPDKPIIFANDSFLALTGYTREEVLGQSFNFLMARGGDAEGVAQIEAAFEGSSDSDPEVRYRRQDGSVFWASIFISPVRDESGDIVQYFASFVDLTKHRAEQERLQFLLNELNHRTQNTLATVLAIAGQTLSQMADEETVNTFAGRILALSKGHSLLGVQNWDRVGLRDVLDEILQPFGLNEGQRPRLSIEGDDIRLQPKTALTLAMVFHELATNAVKHGALSNEKAGQIDIAWRLEPVPAGDQMRLRWQESGGPPVTQPGHKGFGSRLIERGLAQELNGEVHLTYEPTGVVCQIVMPVSRGRVESDE